MHTNCESSGTFAQSSTTIHAIFHWQPSFSRYSRYSRLKDPEISHSQSTNENPDIARPYYIVGLGLESRLASPDS